MATQPIQEVWVCGIKWDYEGGHVELVTADAYAAQRYVNEQKAAGRGDDQFMRLVRLDERLDDFAIW